MSKVCIINAKDAERFKQKPSTHTSRQSRSIFAQIVRQNQQTQSQLVKTATGSIVVAIPKAASAGTQDQYNAACTTTTGVRAISLAPPPPAR